MFYGDCEVHLLENNESGKTINSEFRDNTIWLFLEHKLSDLAPFDIDLCQDPFKLEALLLQPH